MKRICISDDLARSQLMNIFPLIRSKKKIQGSPGRRFESLQPSESESP